MYSCDLERMKDLIQTFSQYGATGNGGITRYSLSKEALQARSEFVKRMEAIGAIIETDDLANVYATLQGSDPKAKRIVMGSHADSVMNGGNYDGILGVMSAMEVLTTIQSEKIEHTHPITAMIWTNEEGSLYEPCMMSSGIVCNDYLPEAVGSKYKYEDMMNSKDMLEGKQTFLEAIQKSGFQGKKENRISPEKYLAMFETHIEQGPILENHHKDVGVVDCVLGMFNYHLKFYGQTTHAGTFPMKQRKDAFLAASHALLELHKRIDSLGYDDLVYTTGEVQCHPNLHTCVPDYFEFCIDVRHESKEVRDNVLKIVKRFEDENWDGCTCHVQKAWERETVYFNSQLLEYVKESADELNANYELIHSGAGHDAQFCAYMLPTIMIFVQSKGGLSHCEQEYSSPEHCTEGASIMLNAVLKADQEMEKGA